MAKNELLPMPRHVAIIMDGNGRWAEMQKKPRAEGHKAGSENVVSIAERAFEMGVEYLTLYAFSTENWKRSEDEVSALMSILSGFLDQYLKDLMDRNICLRCLGQIERLPLLVRGKLKRAIAATKHNSCGTLIFALSYGSRTEITDAARALAAAVQRGELSLGQIDEHTFSQYLYVPDVSDPDLMIRTSSEYRLSNFLLWQLAYSEFYITDTLWPDFTPDDFEDAVHQYQKRSRRFGGR